MQIGSLKIAAEQLLRARGKGGEFAASGLRRIRQGHGWRNCSLRIAENCGQGPRRFKSTVVPGSGLPLRCSRTHSPSSFRHGVVGRGTFFLTENIAPDGGTRERRFFGFLRSFDYCLTTFDDSLTASELYPLRYSSGMPGRNIKVKNC